MVPPLAPSFLAQQGRHGLRGPRRAKPGSAGEPVRTGELGFVLRPMRTADWDDVVAIYEEGIATRMATFETAAPAWAEWDAAHLAEHRLVAEEGGEVVGWAALGPYSSRPCYAGVAEESVYVAERARGRGLGRELLANLVRSAERAGIWTLQAGVFPENKPSLALHIGCGFRVVGVRERIGKLDGAWRDVVLLERRSAAVL